MKYFNNALQTARLSHGK